MDTLLIAFVLVIIALSLWLHRGAITSGKEQQRLDLAEKELSRAKEILAILSSDLPDIRDALDRMSKQESVSDGDPLSKDESDGKVSD